MERQRRKGPYKRRRDPGTVANHQLHPYRRASLPVPWQVRRQPSDHDAGEDEQPGGDDEAARIARSHVLAYNEQDMAEDRDRDARKSKCSAVLYRVGDVRNDHIHDGAPGETGNRQSLHVDGRPCRVDGLDDGGQEDGVGEQLDIAREIQEAKRPNFPVFDGGLDVGAVQGLRRGS